LWSYGTGRQRGLTRKGAIGSALSRFTYFMKIKVVLRRANKLLASSEWTKDDYVRLFGVKPSRIEVCELGVSKQRAHTKKDTVVKFDKNVSSPWGYLPEAIDLNSKPFLLFIGGADPRRRLIDLVAAYNNLKAQGHDIRLVFTGDSMQGPDKIANPTLQAYLRNSTSYADDLIYLGFVTDNQREWLYANALAFVFPSVYEGFGLPVLEAMQNGCPVIAYMNTSIIEVAGDAVLTANGYKDIMKHALALKDDSKLRQNLIEDGRRQAAKFTWRKTSKEVMGYLSAGSS
jgi:glycosyltransferase involved in cell wall biosynthesis